MTRTEESLKQVAESVNTKELKKITGMVRVGDLSKGLLLASDRVVDLVLLTKRPPTAALLAEVETTLKEKLKVYQDSIKKEQVGPPDINKSNDTDEIYLKHFSFLDWFFMKYFCIFRNF